MSVVLPTIALDKVTDIDPWLIRRMNASALLVDVDNTLAPHGSQTPFPGTLEWAERMRSSGIQILLMSNNFKKRVKPFAAQYGLPFLSLSLKPFPLSYWRALRKLHVDRARAVAVGDQVFTDVIGANLFRLKSILLVPREGKETLSIRIRRALERPIREKIKTLRVGEEYLKRGR